MSRQEREQFCREICSDLTDKYHARCRYQIYPISNGQQRVSFKFDYIRPRPVLTVDDIAPLMTEVPDPSGQIEALFLATCGKVLLEYKRDWEAKDKAIGIACLQIGDHFQSDVKYKYVNYKEGQSVQVSLTGDWRILEVAMDDLDADVSPIYGLLLSGFQPASK